MHHYDSALFYYRMSIPFSDDIQMELNKVNAYNGIAKIYKEKNNLILQYGMLKKYWLKKLQKLIRRDF